ncbi:MAG: Ig-like domain-containing protein [Oscillospiraceae bacterium]|nr:Ig-like domain-containing protein [Oscillospiraceae bacterium]
MKTNLLRRFLCTVLTVAMLLTLCPFGLSVSAASMKLNYSSISLTKGYSVTLKATGASGTVQWSSSDKSVAAVSSKGKVYAKKKGTAYIYAKAGGVTAKCKVNIVNGKLTVSQSTVNLTEGEVENLTITAKGSHSLKLAHEDKTIAKGTWVKPWDGDDITLRITAVGEGTARIKVSMSKYTEIYKYITVNVDSAEEEEEFEEESTSTAKTKTILLEKTSLSVNKDSTGTFQLYSDNPDAVQVTSSDTTVATVSEPKWNGRYATVTVKGLKSGKATINVTAKDNSAVKAAVSVSVTSNGYYEISTLALAKRLSTDTVIEWTDGAIKKYMLVPTGYDMAYVNSLIAKDAGKYSYYAVYDALPTKLAEDDYTTSFKVKINGKSVTRYVLLPKNYDKAEYNTLFASYSGKFSYWTIYNTTPIKQTSTDVVQSWQAVVNGKAVTRYVLLPQGYSASQLESLKESDTANAGSDGLYYVVTYTAPSKLKPTDLVYSFNYIDTVTGTSKTAYILLPADYDQAKRDTAAVKLTGNYNYWVIYTEAPEKIASSDTVKDWSKVIDGKATKRYILVPDGYNENILKSIMSEDVNNSSVYYIISTTYPDKASSSDIVYSWKNPKTGIYKYMLLPSDYNRIKRNDIVASDSGEYRYYNVYSVTPVKSTDTDKILSFSDATYGTIYMLVPENYSNDDVTKGMNGTYYAEDRA